MPYLTASVAERQPRLLLRWETCQAEVSEKDSRLLRKLFAKLRPSAIGARNPSDRVVR